MVESDLGGSIIHAAIRESCDQLRILLQDINAGKGTGNLVRENSMPTSNVPFRIHLQDPSKSILPTTEKAVKGCLLGAHYCESIEEGLTKLVLRDPMSGLDATARNSFLHIYVSSTEMAQLEQLMS